RDGHHQQRQGAGDRPPGRLARSRQESRHRGVRPRACTQRGRQPPGRCPGLLRARHRRRHGPRGRPGRAARREAHQLRVRSRGAGRGDRARTRGHRPRRPDRSGPPALAAHTRWSRMMRGARSRAIVTALSAAVLISAGCSGSSSDDTAQQGAEDDFRVAVLTSGPVNDNGYNADAQRAADYIAEEHGAEVAVSESVPVPNQADVYRQFAQQGYDLVIGWGGQYSDGAVEVSAEFPDVTFLVVNSNVENGSNLGSLDHAIGDWHFMVGWLQAKLSKTGVIGWIGAQCFPATAAGQHGTEQGAEYADPDITIHSTFTGDFEDPTKARQ